MTSKIKNFHIGATAAVLALTAISARAATAPVTINGNTVSADVRSIGGAAYVRMSDIAKALGMVVEKHGSGYEIKKAGGAGQIEGVLTGKIGDKLFDGRWRFQVLSMETVDSYTVKTSADTYDDSGLAHLNSSTHVLTARDGNVLIMLRCRLINGQKTTEQLWIPRADTNTALADTQGESHPPILYDFDGAPTETKPMAPGSKIDFPLFFSVPAGTTPQDLIFTLHNNHDSQPRHDVRISLLNK